MRISLFPTVLSAALAVCLVLGAGACETASHENIDKWGHTVKGPGKLLEALKSTDNSADIRAHAAQVLIEIGKNDKANEVLEALAEAPRNVLLAPLADRLWGVARVNDEMSMPSPKQSNAKDALFHIMKFSDSSTRVKIAEYLVEWFVGASYEGRATSGRVSGAMAIRAVGAAAGPRLVQVAQARLAHPPDEQGRRLEVSSELLKALALTGDAKALTLLMNLFSQPRGDKTLPKRVLNALIFAYVEPLGLEAVDGKALLPIAEKLEALPYDENLSGTMRNDAIALLAAIGAPECIALFTKMVNYPTERELFRWMGTQHGMRCAGVQGIEAITEALPPKVKYRRDMLSKYLWDEILKYQDSKGIAAAALRLLNSKNPVARISGIELLSSLGKKAASSKNIKAIKGLSGDLHPLIGWWGDQSGTPKKARKANLTIGQRASDVAKSLAALASEPASK